MNLPMSGSPKSSVTVPVMVRFWARASPPAMNSPDRAARVLVKTFFSWKLIRLIGWLIKDYVEFRFDFVKKSSKYTENS